MLVNVKDLAAKGNKIDLHETMDLSELLNGRADVAEFGPLTVELQALPREGLTDVTGTLTLPLKLVCSRCLTPTPETLTIPFHETFALRESDVPKEEAEETHVLTADKVELTPYVEEAVWLALPYVPVCREDCQGLCPECGVNRNEQACGCSRNRIDPRLAGLADFFDQT